MEAVSHRTLQFPREENSIVVCWLLARQVSPEILQTQRQCQPQGPNQMLRRTRSQLPSSHSNEGRSLRLDGTLSGQRWAMFLAGSPYIWSCVTYWWMISRRTLRNPSSILGTVILESYIRLEMYGEISSYLNVKRVPVSRDKETRSRRDIKEQTLSEGMVL